MQDPQMTPDAGDFEPDENPIVRRVVFRARHEVTICTFGSGSRVLTFGPPSHCFQLHFGAEQWRQFAHEVLRELAEVGDEGE